MSNEIETVRAIYDAISAGDTAAIVSRLAPDIRISQTPELPWGGTFEGLAGFAQFSKTLRTHIDSRVAVERIFEAGADVVVIGRTIGQTKATGAPFDVAIAHVLTVREGKVIEARYFIDTPAMLAALNA
jgi:ketosteroid isomerase-like protein